MELVSNEAIKSKVPLKHEDQIDDLEIIHFSNTLNSDGTYRFNAVLKNDNGWEYEYIVNVPAHSIGGLMKMITDKGTKGFSAIKVKRTYLQSIWMPEAKEEVLNAEKLSN
jgi:hypothetical protein